jgi:hypothetical protein
VRRRHLRPRRGRGTRPETTPATRSATIRDSTRDRARSRPGARAFARPMASWTAQQGLEEPKLRRDPRARTDD